MRRSGGLKFGSREVVVYRDGRVVHRRHDDNFTVYRGADRLNEEQLAQLAGLLEQAEFVDPAVAGRQSADAYAYEIAARVGRRLRTAEASTGAIPEALQPLIRWLSKLMAQDADAKRGT
jgi:hypothetical protein